MFKISKLNELKTKKIEINTFPIVQHLFENGVKQIINFETLEFIIMGSDSANEYSLCFRLNKIIDRLQDIELNTSVPIEKFIDVDDIQLGVNGIFDLEVKVYGNIYRIISNTIIINGVFISSADEMGKFEIEFDLNDYINKDEKSDI